jgi:fibronectin type 3 domain-containing protein
VTGIKQGTVTVTATATDGSGVVSNDCMVTVTASTSAQSNYFGINIGTDLDWDNNRMFADAMKSSRAWGTSSDAGATLPTSALDANGWPTQNASLYVWAGIDRMQGTYALSFNGQATVEPSSGSITNQAYNSSTNLTTATLTYTASDSDYLTLTFTNTKRTSSSSTNSGITNAVLMRPNAVGSTTPLASTQVFNPPFLAALDDFAALRTMDYSATNGNEIAHWSDRTRPGDASQAIGNPGVPAGGWEGPGGAWEYAVLLANTSGKDLWINVPLNADDDYITKLAQLMKYGSDGTTPYTSAQTSPVWPGLNSNLHLYVEIANEVWNTAGAFQGNENHTEAVAEVNAGGSPLNFDGDTNDWNWAWRRPAEKTVQISTIFRTVWGDGAMMTNVRPVLESQLGYADGPLLQEMHLMVDYYYNPTEVSSPQPPSYYIYGLGGSAYYNPTDFSSVNSIFATMATGFVSFVEGDVDYALPFGVRRIAYEGGPSLDTTGNSSEDANQAAAWADPRMEQVIVTEQNAWSQANGDLLVYFYLAGTEANSTAADYQWAFMSDVLSPSSPKMSGIADILASPRSASTYGTPIPATLTASNANVPPAWLWSDGSNTQMHDYKWTGFSVLVSTQGVFTVTLTADSATSGAQAEILVDGNSIGTVTVPSSGNTAALSTPALSVGSHGILVRSLTGTFDLTHVVVQTGVTNPQTQTITFNNPGAQTVGTPLTLVATASSSLTVSFASTTTGVCTVSSTTATFLIAGTCSITASQAGNATYAAATPVTQSFTVNSVSGPFYAMPPERTTLWQPGVTYNGGIPTNRTQCGLAVNPSADETGATDPTNIQNAIDACPAGEYVLLGPGTFYLAPQPNGSIYIEKSNITLRGSGAGVTILNQVGPDATTFSAIVAGFQWYHWPQEPSCGSNGDCTDLTIGSASATSDGLIPLTADAVKESNTATVATASIVQLSTPLVVGELFHMTEQFDPNWTWYNPGQATPAGQCDTASTWNSTNSVGYCGWGEDWADTSLGASEDLVSRPIGQANVLTAITTNGATTTLTFAAPWHHVFRVSHAANLARISSTGQFYTGIGIENLTVANAGGGDGGGNIVFWAISNSWIKNVESYNAGGGAIHFSGCFRCELRDSYLHTAGNPNPGGGGYGMEIDTYTADSLFENNISWSFNKVMVMRGAGGGNVIGYNYFEDGYGAGYYGCPSSGTDPQGNVPYTSPCDGIPEAGMNATHMAGTQYALFEGNQTFSISADGTWGNSDYITFFRNHATTLRRNVNNGTGTDTGDSGEILCSTFSCFGPVVQLADTMGRTGVSLYAHQWWYSYVGNVLGYPNNYLQNPAIGYAYPAIFSAEPQSSTWFFEWNGINNGGAAPGQDPNEYWTSTLWELGTGEGTTPDVPSTIPGAGQQTVLNTLLRDGNFDYVTNKTLWMGSNNICNAPGDAACSAINTGNICIDPNLCAGQYTTAPAVSALPNSLYIPASMQPPPFFKGGTWPWVDGTNASNPLPGMLPARTRFDAGTPNTVTTLTPPAAPTGLTATPGNATVALSWTASSGATSYNVYRGTTAGGESTTAIATGVTTASYTDSTAANGNKYYYKVAAVNGGGASALSNEASATPEPAAPAAPTGLTATAGNATVLLTWTASAGAASYNVYRGTTAGGESTTAIATDVTTASYTDSTVTNNTTYYYKVAAVNGGGISPLSNEASATPTATAPHVAVIPNVPAYPLQVLPGSTRQINVQITGGTLNTINWSWQSTGTKAATASFTTPAASNAATVTAGLPTVQVNIGAATGNENCTINGSMGTYAVTSPVQITVTAQSVDNPAVSGTFLFNICAKTTTVIVAPAYQQAYQGQHMTLQSWVSGDTDETGTWSITGKPSGGDGVLADTSNRDTDFVATVTGRYIIQYTSHSNPAKSATAIVYVSPNAMPSYVSTPNQSAPHECYRDPALTGGDYEVGAGKAYATISSTPAIATLAPGSMIRIWNTDTTGSNPSTFHEYYQIASTGTATQPIIVCGVPDSAGNLPILDGSNATGQSDINTDGAAAGAGIISVWTNGGHYGYWQDGSAGPSYVSITGLHVRNANVNYGYYPPSSTTLTSYQSFVACVYLGSGTYIDVSANELDNCGLGLFTAENANNGWATITQEVTVMGNHIQYAGEVGDYSEHSVYFQVWYGLMQGNLIDNFTSGAEGSAIKWRGVEGIFRYNNLGLGAGPLGTGPARDFDLVENQDAAPYVTFEGYLSTPGDTVCDDSFYCLGDTLGANGLAAYQESAQKDFIYGNMIFGTSAEAQIHYAEDNVGGMNDRNGTLYFYSNTLDNAQIVFDTGENGDGFNPILQPRVDARNNILWARNVAWSGVIQMEFASDATIILDATTNLMQSGTFTIAIPIEGAIWQDGTQEGWPSTCDSTPCFWPLTVPLNTHLYGLSNTNYLTTSTLPYNATTLVPVAGSAAIEAGTPLSGLLATMPVRWQYSPTMNSLMPRLDPLTVGAEDYGAPEGAPSVPTGLSATAGNASVALSWTAVTGATSYNVYRGTTASGESTTAIATGVTTAAYSDTGLTNGQQYYYEVAGVNGGGTGPLSNEASATPELSALSDPTIGVLPSYDDAYANWKNAGLALVGGIPDRTAPCATVNPLGGGQDDFTNIQNAINGCPAGEVVQLGAGAFSVLLADLPISIAKGITLRGTGDCTGTSSPYCQTSITVIDGILPYQVDGFSPFCGTSSSTETDCPNGGEPEILMSPVLPDYNYSWEQCSNVGGPLGTGCGATPLAADAVQGQTTIQVTSTSNFTVGSWVLIDEASGAGWQPDPMSQSTGYVNVWAASDWLSPSGSPATGRVAWAKFDVSVDYEGDFGAASSDIYPYQANTPGCWHSYCDRPTAELHKVASIGAGPCPGTNCTVTFDDPLTIAFRESGGHNAQVYARLYGNNSGTGSPISMLQQAGVENISLLRSPEGGLEMELCVNCWVKNTEIGDWVGGGLGLEYSARSEINTVYVHHCWDSVNSGGEYPIDLGNASTEMLITNSITNFGGKGMVARSGGAGSVVSYNYIDDSMYDDNSGIGDYWLDMSVNASHEAGPHHVLFEGNWGDNLDSDNTHGNSTYITFFRNLGTGLRTPFDDPSIGSTALVDDYTGKGYYCPSGLASCVQNIPGPLRAAGPMAYSYWFAFVGNVLGVSGTTTAANGWTYSGDFTAPRIFMLGWNGGNGGQDPNLNAPTGSYILISGNYDYLNNAVTWQGSPVTLPNSFYLPSKPSFFTSSYPWPWVTPTGSKQIQNGPSGCGGTCSGLPAQARWQAGTPFVQP